MTDHFTKPSALPGARTGAAGGTLTGERETIDVTMSRVRASQAAQLSAFSSLCFDQTYGPLCRAADVDAHIAKCFSPAEWLRVLTDGTSWVFAVIIDEQWAGYTHLQLAALPEGVVSKHAAAPSVTPVEICRFYVARRWHGHGVAATMLANVCAHATAHGAESVWLSSWQGNARANAFYAKCDFEKIGETTFLLGEELQHDFLLERVLVRNSSNTRTQ